MLAEIHASESSLAGCMKRSATSTPAAVEELCLTMRGQTSADFMPTVKAVCAERLSRVPTDRLKADLLLPLKKGIGNAYKRGNKKDPAKAITVQAAITGAGAVVSVSDEGTGFDVEDVLGRLRRDEQYYANHGSGFAIFTKTRSAISYVDGGSTLLIRFLCAPEPGRAVTDDDLDDLGRAGDASVMKAFFVDELHGIFEHDGVLASCRVYVPEKQEAGTREISYVLSHRESESGNVVEATLTGQVLSGQSAADPFSVSERLRELPLTGEDCINVPRPVAVLSQPPVLVYDLNPSTDLRGYAKALADGDRTIRVCEMVGRSLRIVHRSGLGGTDHDGAGGELDRYRDALASVEGVLSRSDKKRNKRVRAIFRRLEERSAGLKDAEPVTVHGDLDWNRIVYDEPRLYLTGLHACGRGHPGIDLGAFLTDLLRFCKVRRKRGDDFYDAGRDAFLAAYFAGDVPSWSGDLPFFIGGTMLLRLERLLGRPKSRWERKIDDLLDQCESVVDSPAT